MVASFPGCMLDGLRREDEPHERASRLPRGHCGGVQFELKYPSMLEAKDILAAALKLDTRERARLVDELSASLEGIELSSECENAIQRRIDDIDAGRVNTVPGDAVLSRLKRRFSGR